MKNLVTFFVKRPVTSCMFMLVLIILGAIALANMQLAQFPNINMPIASIQVSYPGASPSEMDTLVTEKIINGISGLSGINEITGNSSQGRSQVVVQCNYGSDMNYMVFQLQAAVNGLTKQLPTGITTPIVRQFDMSNSQPVITLSLAGGDEASMRDYADNVLQDEFQQINGVGEVDVYGGLERQFNVDLNPYQLQSLNMSINTITNSLNNAYANMPGGTFNQGDQQVNINANEEINKLDTLQNVVVYNSGGQVLRLKDVSNVYVGTATRTSYANFDGKPTVSLDIIPTSTGNAVDIAKEVKLEIPQIQAQLPQGMKLSISEDSSTFIIMFVDLVKDAAIIALILASLIVFLFLKNWRATLIVAISIPFSIMSAFIILYLQGYNLNMMTLFGLMLGVGMLVDNSVIIIENIFRHMQEYKKSPINAAIDGASEIALSVILATLSIVVIFLPITFIPSMIGQYFTPFCYAIIWSVVASLIIALSIVPMLSSFLLDPEKLHDEPGKVFRWVQNGYAHNINKAVSNRKKLVYGAFLLFIITIMVAPKIVGSQFFPQNDQGNYTVIANTAGGISIQKSDDIAKQIEAIISKAPYTESYSTIVNQGQVNVTVNLPDASKRKQSVFQIMNKLRPELNEIPDTKVMLINGSARGNGQNSQDLEVQVLGPDQTTLNAVAAEVQKAMQSVPGVIETYNSNQKGAPEENIEIDRVKAQQFGVSADQLANFVNSATMGAQPFQINAGSNAYDVNVQYANNYFDNITKLQNLNFPLSNGGYVPLSQIATIKLTTMPTTLQRQGKDLVINVSANIQGKNLGGIMGKINEAIKTQVNFPAGYSFEYGGASKNMNQGGGDLLAAFGMGLLLIYMMLASLFESFLTPIIIMIAIPLAIIGVYAGLIICGLPMSMPAMLGVIMLAGIVVNNSIVKIQYIIIRRQMGESAREAVQNACIRRLRPILITAMTAGGGMLPIAFGIGSGASFFQPLAIAVIFGIIVSTATTLFIVPSLYVMFDSLTNKIVKKKRV